MPLLAYIWKVGVALLALLFAVDLYLPKTPVVQKFAVDRPTIRIQSDRKWPERVVLDTSQPIIVSAASGILTARVPASIVQREAPVIRTDSPRIGNARTDPPPREAIDRKRPRKTQLSATRSKRHTPPQMLLAARQAQFGWFGYRYW
ncbi:hypothetical protein ACVWXP_001970 [Bradyrhizobium sp. USDA 4463]